MPVPFRPLPFLERSVALDERADGTLIVRCPVPLKALEPHIPHLLRRNAPDAQVASFRFKAVRPTFDLHPFRVNGAPQADGKTVKLWAQDHEGWLTMDAVATLR